jgi:hypothetical protein
LRKSSLVAAIIFLVIWGLTTHGKYSVTGDEPHYLLVSQSLLADGDLDLRNNYENGDGRLFGSSGLQPELHARTARDGRFLPVHDIGLPVLLLPVYAVATYVARFMPEEVLARFRMSQGLFAYSLISLAIALSFCVSAAITRGALLRQGITPRASAAIVFAVWLTAPVLSNSFLVFPEAIAILVTAWTVYACSGTAARWSPSDTLLVLALGALPWVHRKYAIYALALAAVLIWMRRDRLTARTALVRLAPLYVLPQLALAWWTYRHWGNLAGPIALDRLPFSWDAFAHGLAGTFVDREHGLLWWAPAYAILPAAWWIADAKCRAWIVPMLALLIPGAAHDQWWGGFSPAVRFLVPAAPIACLIAAPALVRSVRLRAAAVVLFVPQAVIAAYGWQHARLLWPHGDGHNRILEVLAPQVAAWAPSLRMMTDHVWARTLEVLLAIALINVLLAAASQREMAVPAADPVSPTSRR